MTGFSADDYSGAARSLLPRGPAWPGTPESVQGQTMAGIAPTFERSDAAAVQLLADTRPDATLNLLPEWEESLGLPDPCAGSSPTIAQRRAQVVARFIGGGGQSRPFFITFAHSLGFEISIDTFAPFRADASAADDPVCDDSWSFAWLVTVLSNATSIDNAAFRADLSYADDPLETDGTSIDVLQCEFERLKAAETDILFAAS